MIRIAINDQCQGHGNCYLNFPELFEPNDESFAEPVNAEVSADNLPQLRSAISGCPAGAISMQEIDSRANA